MAKTKEGRYHVRLVKNATFYTALILQCFNDSLPHACNPINCIVIAELDNVHQDLKMDLRCTIRGLD